MDRRQMARYVAARSTEPIAVFLIDWKLRTIKMSNEEKVDKLFRDCFHQCVGVYLNVVEDWVYDDLMTFKNAEINVIFSIPKLDFKQ